MNKANENFSTPVQTKVTKRLGLRRKNSSSINKSQITGVGTQHSIKDTIQMPCMEPQSDAKINYRNLENSNRKYEGEYESSLPATPSTSNLLRTQSVSTNCRPYRMSLSRRVREKMTKKRLQFHIANETDKEEKQGIFLEEDADDKSLCKKVNANETTNLLSLYIEPEKLCQNELLVAIKQARHELNSRQSHLAKVQDLQQAIQTWQNGFSMALNDLQEKMVPRLDKEVLLEHLHMPKEMIKYVKD